MLSNLELSHIGRSGIVESNLEGYSLIIDEKFQLMYFSNSNTSTVTAVLATGKRLFLSLTGSELLIELSSRKNIIRYSKTKFSSSAFSTYLRLSNEDGALRSSKKEELAARLGFEPTSAFEIVCNFVGKPLPSLVSATKSV